MHQTTVYEPFVCEDNQFQHNYVHNRHIYVYIIYLYLYGIYNIRINMYTDIYPRSRRPLEKSWFPLDDDKPSIQTWWFVNQPSNIVAKDFQGTT